MDDRLSFGEKVLVLGGLFSVAFLIEIPLLLVLCGKGVGTVLLAGAYWVVMLVAASSTWHIAEQRAGHKRRSADSAATAGLARPFGANRHS